MRKICCTCLSRIENEDAPVLVMGAYGTPKLLCDQCAELVETITLGTDFNEITGSMQALMDRMSASNVDDKFTLNSVTKLLTDSAKRAQKIKEGTYDFSLDEAEDPDSFDEIPEELQETEEDKLLDEKEAAANAKFDKVMSWIWVGVGVGALGFIIWKLIDLFFLK